MKYKVEQGLRRNYFGNTNWSSIIKVVFFYKYKVEQVEKYKLEQDVLLYYWLNILGRQNIKCIKKLTNLRKINTNWSNF